MPATTLNRLTNEKIEEWVEQGIEFTAASMHGEPGSLGPFGTGRLDKEWTALYNAHGRRIIYTISSYSTPIAWKITEGWVIVTQTFSMTTGARHQPRVRYLRPVAPIWCPGAGRPAINPGRLDGTLVRDGGRMVGGCPECGATVTATGKVAAAHFKANP